MTTRRSFLPKWSKISVYLWIYGYKKSKIQTTLAHVIPEGSMMPFHDYTERLAEQTRGMLPMAGQDLARSFENIPERYINIERTHHFGALRCSVNVTLHSLQSNFHQNTHRRPRTQRLCPVQWVNNTDVNRLPNSLIEATCKCDTRILRPDTQESHGIPILCQPVTSYVTVFRRVGHSDEDYVKVYEPLSTACIAMVIPPVNHRHPHRTPQ